MEREVVEDIDIITWIPGNSNDRSVTGFRIRHGGSKGPMSRKFYAALQERGIGPRETLLNHKVIITAADEAAWEAARANPVGTEAELQAQVREFHHKRAKKAGKAAAASPRHVSNQKRRRRNK